MAENEEYSFINKIWIAGVSPKNKVLRIILLVCGGILLLGGLIQLMFDGFREFNWFSGAILPLILIGQSFNFTRRGGYTSCLLNIEVRQDQVTFTYPNIDRLDRAGVRHESIMMARGAVDDLQYDEAQKSKIGRASCRERV